ncbi:MAG: hypothetical protein R3350_10835 [Saprospiraceae bacterium]|nr:hypothetical protein [Saprospiraceae bacterium]
MSNESEGRPRTLEIFLLQVVIYLLLWLADEYLASLLSLIFGSLAFILLLFAGVVELVEKSKVPRIFYIILLVSFLAPLLTGLVFVLTNGIPAWLLE